MPNAPLAAGSRALVSKCSSRLTYHTAKLRCIEAEDVADEAVDKIEGNNLFAANSEFVVLNSHGVIQFLGSRGCA